MEVVLPAPFTPASMITNGRSGANHQRLFERTQEVDHGAGKLRAGVGGLTGRLPA